MLHKTLIAFAAAVALGCVPVATIASAAPHGHVGRGHTVAGHIRGGHVARYRGGHVARYRGGYDNGPVYDSCAGYGPGYGYGYGYGPGYGYGGCPGYGVPIVGGVINGILRDVAPY